MEKWKVEDLIRNADEWCGDDQKRIVELFKIIYRAGVGTHALEISISAHFNSPYSYEDHIKKVAHKFLGETISAIDRCFSRFDGVPQVLVVILSYAAEINSLVRDYRYREALTVIQEADGIVNKVYGWIKYDKLDGAVDGAEVESSKLIGTLKKLCAKIL